MGGAGPSATDADVDLGRLFAGLRENWRRILLVALAVTGIAFLLAAFATPHYLSESRILIETRESIYTRAQDSGGDDRPILDEEGVASQVELITSSDILSQVARDLDLASREEFDAGDPSFFGRLLVLAGLKSDRSDVPPEQRALGAFRDKLNVYRVQDSRVIVVEFSSVDPELAARVPDAVAEAYVDVQRAAKLASNMEATQWLEPEIADLRQQVREAEARVAAFRAESDLLMGPNNAVLSTQQLSELSSEMSRVRANRSSAEAKAEAVRAALDRGVPVESQPDVLESDLIQRLRERAVDLETRIAELSTTLLENHPRIRSLEAQLADLDARIREEARKVLDGFEAQAETARLRERELRIELDSLKVQSARADEEQVELRALEREATAQRELLESYLTRHREAVSRQDRSYLPVDARIFAHAVVPSEPYSPKIWAITVTAFAASLLVMAVATLLAELFSGRAMRPAARPGVEPVEQVTMPADWPRAQEDDAVEEPADDAAEAEAEQVNEDYVASPLGEVGVGTAAEKLIAGGAMRAVFVSPEGDEGAAAAVLVAREVADAGLRVLLLDLTASAAVSRPMLESASYAGITNLLASEAQFADIIHPDLYSDCHVIPVGTADMERAMRAADRLPIVMQSLTTAYDVVVVECGPADPAGIAGLVDEDTQILVSVLDPAEGSTAVTVGDLEADGFGSPIVVTPAAYRPPTPDRDVA